MLERYIKVTKIRIDSELFSFCQITQVKKRRVVVSYTTMREQFKKKVKQLGYPIDAFAYTAFGEEPLQQQPMWECRTAFLKDIRRRWGSENAKDGYVKAYYVATRKHSVTYTRLN